MFRNLTLPVLAAGLLVYASVHAYLAQRPEPDVPPPMPPPSSPFGNTVAGAGMVEPCTEASGTGAIAVGSQLPGVVTRVQARIGRPVKAGQLLFELDRRETEASLQARLATLESARAQLRKLQLQPRPEEVPPLEAQVAAAEATVRQLKDLRDRDLKMLRTGAVAPQDVVLHEQVYRAARGQLEVARANLALLKAGAWDADKTISYAAVKQAQAQVDQDRTRLELLQVRAPVDGTVLQVNVRPGEYVGTTPGQALVLMGNLSPLHVRVNIDEEDLPRLRLSAPARAKVRGDRAQAEVPMRYVRLEPFVVPKASLTGINIERVDTRVAQVIYAIDPEHRLVREKKILVGQLVDVFIDTSP
jgi:multidrug resistance efflux pump